MAQPKKTIDTLIEDISSLFDPTKDHQLSPENVEKAGEDFKELLRTRLSKREESGDALRFSSLGKEDRQIWHQAKDTPKEEMQPNAYFKFLYGDMIELLVLFLAKEAGHTVADEQKEIEVDGVKGHIDAIIDGVVVDVKSASPFSFQKFKNGKLLEDDPFGYIQQLSGYAHVLTPNEAPYFFAVDKVSGQMHLMEVSTSITADYAPAPRIEHLKNILASDTPPPPCKVPVPDGKSGNMKLDTLCSYCAYKKSCYPEIRTFLYSNGPRYLTKVAKVPDVYEVQE